MSGAIADKVLDSQFQADCSNQKWVADFIYIRIAEGRLYVEGVLDLFSRRIAGWSMQTSVTSQLVADALVMAVWRRGMSLSRLPYSDQGRQYTSEHFQGLLKELGITLQQESRRQGLGQLCGRELLQFLEDRPHCPESVSASERSTI
ncbi:hypothetical protein DLREEDagrD3_22830 [Denitratisoma sp. agr-D3]